MPEQKEYLDMMCRSLEKKKEMLNQLVLLNAEQGQIIRDDEMDMADFSRNVEKKTEIIEQLDKLDEGFEALYNRIREELLSNRAAYRQEIVRLQKLISEITDRSASIQAAELRNKQKIEKHFALLHKNVKKTRVSNKAAASYYKNMSSAQAPSPPNIDIRSNN